MQNGKRVPRPACLRPRYDHTQCMPGRDGKRVCRPVYTVNEDCIRNHVTVNYAAGGNPYAYPWAPANKLFVSSNLPRKERIPIARHELREFIEMKYGHKSYPEAHRMANRDEAKYRAKKNGEKSLSYF